MLSPLSDGFKDFLDVLSVAVVGGVLAAVLPALASILTIVWTAIRIYDRIKYGKSKGD